MVKSRSITKIAVICALYIVLTLMFAFSSFSTMTIQFRLSEAMTILPLLMWEAVPALYLGCLIANIVTGSVLDIFFGSLATLLAGMLTYFVGRVIKTHWLRLTLGGAAAIVINSLLVPMTFTIFVGEASIYWLCAFNVFVGEAVVIIIAGIPLYYAMRAKFASKAKVVVDGDATSANTCPDSDKQAE